MSTFRIRVEKDYIGFSAGHFITYSGHQCETLHGHNYRVRIALQGSLDRDFYVMDFVEIKRMMKRLCDDLDHRMLLPLHNPVLQLVETDESVSVSYKHRRFVFPSEDVVLLPIANTTAELLAQYLCGRALDELRRQGARHLQWIEIEVEESAGQSAVYREELTAANEGEAHD